MCEGGTAVILQWTKHRIGIDLVTHSCQRAAAIIIAYVVAIRGEDTDVTDYVISQDASLQNSASDCQRRAAQRSKVGDAAANRCRVSVKSAVLDGKERDAAADGCIVDRAGLQPRGIATECSVVDGQRCGAVAITFVLDCAAREVAIIRGQSTVGYCEQRAADGVYGVIRYGAAGADGRVVAEGAVGD